MGEYITPQHVLFFISVFGALSGVWWRIEARLREVRSEAQKDAQAAQVLAATAMTAHSELRLHCAETYVSKAGLREVRDEIMESIRGIRDGVDHLSTRMDRVIEKANEGGRPASTRSRASDRG